MPTEALFAELNEVTDPQKASDLEKMHAPHISAPQTVRAGQCFDVTIEVGKWMHHPNEHGHFIEFIELYTDRVFLAKADLTAVSTCPKVCFCASLTGHVKELRAYQRCNLHGVWVSRKSITVTE